MPMLVLSTCYFCSILTATRIVTIAGFGCVVGIVSLGRIRINSALGIINFAFFNFIRTESLAPTSPMGL